MLLRSPRSSCNAQCTATMGPYESCRWWGAAALVALAAAATTLTAVEAQSPVPQHTSILTGELWVQELLAGNAARMHNNLGMNTHVFVRLITALVEKAGPKDTWHISKKEQLAIFLHAVVTNNSIPQLCECFQQSADTISRMLHHMVKIIISLHFIMPTSSCQTQTLFRITYRTIQSTSRTSKTVSAQSTAAKSWSTCHRILHRCIATAKVGSASTFSLLSILTQMWYMQSAAGKAVRRTVPCIMMLADGISSSLLESSTAQMLAFQDMMIFSFLKGALVITYASLQQAIRSCRTRRSYTICGTRRCAMWLNEPLESSKSDLQ